MDEVKLRRAAVGEHDQHVVAHRARERVGGGDRLRAPNALRIERGVENANAVERRHPLRRGRQRYGRRRVRERHMPIIRREVHNLREQAPNGVGAPGFARRENARDMALAFAGVVSVQYWHGFIP